MNGWSYARQENELRCMAGECIERAMGCPTAAVRDWLEAADAALNAAEKTVRIRALRRTPCFPDHNGPGDGDTPRGLDREGGLLDA